MYRSTLVFAAALLTTAASVPAQKKELIERRDQKLAEPFVTHAPWITDYDAARAAAKKSGKVIFAYFTRSYSP